MSDEYSNEDFDAETEQQQPESPRKNDWRRRLEQEAEEGRRAKEEAAQARRELAFIKAGIDLDSPTGKLFAKGYDGDVSIEAVKAAAVEYGVLTPERPAVPAEELQAHERFTQAAAGAVAQSDDQSAFAELEAAGDFFNGGSPEKVMAVLAKWGIETDSSKPGRWQYGSEGTPQTSPLG